MAGKQRDRDNNPEIEKSEQSIQNWSFDRVLKLLTFLMMGYNDTDDKAYSVKVDQSGRIETVIMAEDVANPGTYVAVQGQYNTDGNFELLTAGSGGTTATTYQMLMETGDAFLMETGDTILLEY